MFTVKTYLYSLLTRQPHHQSTLIPGKIPQLNCHVVLQKLEYSGETCASANISQISVE